MAGNQNVKAVTFHVFHCSVLIIFGQNFALLGQFWSILIHFGQILVNFGQKRATELPIGVPAKIVAH
jgi:hypothetical protein